VAVWNLRSGWTVAQSGKFVLQAHASSVFTRVVTLQISVLSVVHRSPLQLRIWKLLMMRWWLTKKEKVSESEMLAFLCLKTEDEIRAFQSIGKKAGVPWETFLEEMSTKLNDYVDAKLLTRTG